MPSLWGCPRGHFHLPPGQVAQEPDIPLGEEVTFSSEVPADSESTLPVESPSDPAPGNHPGFCPICGDRLVLNGNSPRSASEDTAQDQTLASDVSRNPGAGEIDETLAVPREPPLPPPCSGEAAPADQDITLDSRQRAGNVSVGTTETESLSSSPEPEDQTLHNPALAGPPRRPPEAEDVTWADDPGMGQARPAEGEDPLLNETWVTGRVAGPNEGDRVAPFPPTVGRGPSPSPGQPGPGPPPGAPLSWSRSSLAGPSAWAEVRAEATGYEILGVLGRGGMGVVYKARQVALNRIVALKMILSGSHAGPEDLARFRTEAEAVAKLKHPNIVQVYETGEREGRPYFSLEFLEGGSLQQRMDGTPLPPHMTARLMHQLAGAMHFAHQHGIVHRDLKPANILLAFKEQPPEGSDTPPPLSECIPKITDFGLAKRLDDKDLGHTGTEAILGTPTYMAPEQAEGRTRDVGPEADIYALGAMLYDMLTGRPPFRGTTVMDTLQQVMSSEPVPPRHLQPTIPLDLQTICLKCLEKEEKKRYESAEALAQDLDHFLKGEPIVARPVGRVERVVKWARRRPAVAALMSLVATLLVAIPVVAVAWAWHASHLLAEERKAKKEAELAQQEAEKAQRDAEFNAAVAEYQEQVADWQRDLAEENFLDAQEAVRQIILAAQKHLRHAPGLSPVREKLARDAVKLCQHFLQRQGDTPALRLQAAKAHRLLGDLYELLGQRKEAASHYLNAVDQYHFLQKNAPATAEQWGEDYQGALSYLYLSLWIVLEESDPEQAGKYLDQALEGLPPQASAPPERRYLRGSILNNQGIAFHRQAITFHHPNRIKDAENAYQQAKDLFVRLESEHPNPRYQLELARTRTNLSVLCLGEYERKVAEADRIALTLGKTARANPLHWLDPVWVYQQCASLFELRQQALEYRRNGLTHARQATRELADLRDRFRDEETYQKELGRAMVSYGNLLWSQDHQEGEKVYRKALQVYQQLARDYPYVPDYRHLEAKAHLRLGHVLLENQTSWDEGIQELTTARDKLEALKKEFPEVPVYQEDLVYTLRRLGAARTRFNYQEALQLMEEALQLSLQLVESYPDTPGYQTLRDDSYRNLIALYTAQARGFGQQKEWARTETSVTQLVKLRRELATLHPREPTYQNELAATLFTQADLLLLLDQPVQAANILIDLGKTAPPSWTRPPDALNILNRCRARVRFYPDLSEPKRASLGKDLDELHTQWK